MHSPGAIRVARMRACVFSIVMPRFKRGIQYAVTSRMNANVSGILDRPVKPGDDVRASSSKSNRNERIPPRC
jgi:hypothetical protein